MNTLMLYIFNDFTIILRIVKQEVKNILNAQFKITKKTKTRQTQRQTMFLKLMLCGKINTHCHASLHNTNTHIWILRNTP